MKTLGYAGKILRVNLTTGKIHVEATNKYTEKFIGGRGINAWILFNELDPATKPLDSENIITLGSGPLVGTLSPFSSRVSIDTKNVFNNGVGSANCGGHFGAEMKYAGFDNLVITGRSEKPVYLSLYEGQAEILGAQALWGLTTWEPKEKYGKYATTTK